MDEQKRGIGKKILIIIIFLFVLVLGGIYIYDNMFFKQNDPIKSEENEADEEDLDEVASVLIGKLDKYYVDHYDSKERVDFSKLSDNDKMLGAYAYNMFINNSLNLSKSIVDDYYNNLFGVKLTSYPDLNCWAGDGALFKYNSITNQYETVGDHSHGGFPSLHSVVMKYNNIENNGDDYIITVTKVYGPSQGNGIESPENAFYADFGYITKLDELDMFTRNDSNGNRAPADLSGAKNYYEQNYDQFKNYKPQYEYTFSKKNGDFYLKKYQIIK